MLCNGCKDELVDALLALADGGSVRVRVHIDRRQTRAKLLTARRLLAELEKRQAVGEPVDEAVLARVRERISTLTEVGAQREITDHRQGLLADLEDTVTRRDNTGPSSIGRIQGRDSTHLEYHAAASRLRDHAHNIIGTWARDLHEINPHLKLPDTIIDAAEWLAHLPGLLAVHPAAGEMHGQITALTEQVRRMVDTRPARAYLGLCGAQRGDRRCEWTLTAEQGAEIVQCPRCGTSWETARRRDRMLAAMEEQLLSATDMRLVLSRYLPDGVPPTGTIRRWASEGRLTKKPPHPGDWRQAPRYRVGDVLDLISLQERRVC